MWSLLSPPQRAFVEQALPGCEPVADMSWGEMDTVVLRVSHAAGDHTVKAAGPHNHHIAREIDAHERATRSLAKLDRTPKLVAVDRAANALITTFLPGVLVDGTASETAPDVHRQAGALLRVLHDAVPPARDDGAWDAGETAKMLARLATPHAIPDDLAREADRILRSLRPRPVALVSTHGDWQPRNWIVDGSVVSVIDYGRFAMRPALTDLTRPAEQQWRGRPDLAEAHAEGYGSDLRDDPLWPVVLLREAVGTAVWAHQVRLRDFESQGVRMLADAVARI